MQVWQNFLSQDEISSTLFIIQNLKKKAHVIHGEKRSMLKLIKNMKILKLSIQSKANMFSQRNEIDFEHPIDCSIIWTDKHASPQVWHMDAIENFAVLNIILTTNIPTEFLDSNANDENKFEYPLNWNCLKTLQLNIKPGDGIFFWSNMIHRGPGTLDQERISLYLTFPIKENFIQKNLTTDFAYPNWAWIDSKFENATTLKRSFYQIDFIIKNNLLDLYPLDWHGDKVFDSVSNQINERIKYIENYPPLNIYLIEFEKEFYLTRVTSFKTFIEVFYYPTIKYPKEFIEQIKLEKWQYINKIQINENNLNDYQGYSLTPKKNYQLKTNILIYLFSHLVLKEADIAITKILTTAYIHPLLIHESMI